MMAKQRTTYRSKSAPTHIPEMPASVREQQIRRLNEQVAFLNRCRADCMTGEGQRGFDKKIGEVKRAIARLSPPAVTHGV